MIPKSFEYLAALSVKEAVELLESREDPKVLAGGQSLVALMKLRLMAPKYVVDINRIPNLAYITEGAAGSIAVGALTTHDRLANSEVIRSKCAILSEAASKIGDQQVRNRGTIGGSLCHADPAADLPVTVLALGCDMVTVSSKGERVIKAEDFFVDTFTTAMDAVEILKEVRIPNWPRGSGGAYLKLSRRAGDFAITNVAALIALDKDRVCKRCSVALGASAPTPMRAKATEKELTGNIVDDGAIQRAADAAPEGADPPSDIHGSRDYRLEMIKVMTRRTLKSAVERATGG